MNIYKLENERIYAEVLPERGANLIKFVDKELNADVLRTPKDDSDFENPFFYGTPILFPPNRISGGQFEFEGRKYIFPINEPDTGCVLHGTLHETAFTVTEHNDSHIKCRYEAVNGDLYYGFPHEFALEVSYDLTSDSIVQTVEAFNNSPDNMPFALAFHTTFNVPSENARVCINAEKEYLRDVKYLPTEEVLDDSESIRKFRRGEYDPSSEKISVFFKDGGSKSTVITDGKLTVNYEVSDGYGYWMVYNGVSNDFICIEPQTWLTNCPNLSFDREESGFQIIKPSESKIYTAKIYCKNEVSECTKK